MNRIVDQMIGAPRLRARQFHRLAKELDWLLRGWCLRSPLKLTLSQSEAHSRPALVELVERST